MTRKSQRAEVTFPVDWQVPEGIVNQNANQPRSFGLVGELVPGWQLIQPLPLLLEQDTDGAVILRDDLVALGARTDPFDAQQLARLQVYVAPSDSTPDAP